MPLTGVTMTLDLPAGCARLRLLRQRDRAPDSRLTLPLDERGVFLRGDPERPGSFAALLDALRQSRIEGLEPLETIAYDMTAPIATKPMVRLRLTNQRNQPIQGKLQVRLGDLANQLPQRTLVRPARAEVDRRAGHRRRADPANIYPLELVFDAGRDGIARHEEPMRVNCISRAARSPSTAGSTTGTARCRKPIDVTGPGGPSFEEAMLYPFQKFGAEQAEGVAVGYVAHDDDYFYFAAKIADSTAAGRARIVSPRATRTPTSIPKSRTSRSMSAGRTVKPGEEVKLRRTPLAGRRAAVQLSPLARHSQQHAADRTGQRSDRLQCDSDGRGRLGDATCPVACRSSSGTRRPTTSLP